MKTDYHKVHKLNGTIITFEKFHILMENTIGIIHNTFHDLKKKSKVTLMKTTKVLYL